MSCSQTTVYTASCWAAVTPLRKTVSQRNFLHIYNDGICDIKNYFLTSTFRLLKLISTFWNDNPKYSTGLALKCQWMWWFRPNYWVTERQRGFAIKRNVNILVRSGFNSQPAWLPNRLRPISIKDFAPAASFIAEVVDKVACSKKVLRKKCMPIQIILNGRLKWHKPELSFRQL